MFDGPSDSPQIIGVAPALWGSFAGAVMPHLQKMADGSGGRYLLGDMISAVITCRMQLWLAMDGPEILVALLTEVIQYPQIRTLRCVGVVGHKPRRWMHLMSFIEDFARNVLQCDRMEALHTPGHERLLRTGGWRVFHILSEKAL